jgi:hypothetical protein
MPLTERPVPENTILGVLCVDDAITKPIPTIGCMVGGVFGYASVIDRIDPEGHYVPSNCRWATPLIQNSHLRGR